MDASALTNPGRIGTDTHEIDGVGEVKFRGMTRFELHKAGQIGEQHGAAAQEAFILSCCLLDPVMSEAQVKEWQKAAPAGEIAPLQRKINVLSKIGKDAAKSDVQGDGEGPVN
jgi:hypothetical protein